MRLSEIFEQLITIPSPSRQERAVMDWIKRYCSESGLTFTEDDFAAEQEGTAGNVMVDLPATQSDRPNLLLCAHVDTVEKGDRPIQYSFDGTDYTSLGDTILGADDKCGVTCLLGLLAHLANNPNVPHGHLRLVFTVCEEIELLGSSALPAAWLEGMDYGIALDHSLPFQIVTSAPGKNALHLTVQGIAGHGASPQRRINAAHLLCKIMADLPSGQLDEASTCNLGGIQSGTAINVIPGTATAEYEIRSRQADRLDFYTAQIQKRMEVAVAAAAIWADGEDAPRTASLDLTVTPCYAPFALPDDHALVQFLQRAIRKCELQPEIFAGKGGSDANALNARGLPSVVLGCGLHGAHSIRERATLYEMEQCLQILTVLIGEVR